MESAFFIAGCYFRCGDSICCMLTQKEVVAFVILESRMKYFYCVFGNTHTDTYTRKSPRGCDGSLIVTVARNIAFRLILGDSSRGRTWFDCGNTLACASDLFKICACQLCWCRRYDLGGASKKA